MVEEINVKAIQKQKKQMQKSEEGYRTEGTKRGIAAGEQDYEDKKEYSHE